MGICVGIVADGDDAVITDWICVNAGDLAAIGCGRDWRMGDEGWWNGARGWWVCEKLATAAAACD